MKILKETVEFEYFQEDEKGFTSPIKIFVKIDYSNNRIDIVEPEPTRKGNFRKKDYTFINRGAEFMNSWLNILEALQFAIRSAKSKLEDYQKKIQDEKNDDVTQILLQATKIVENKNKKHGKK
jgi:hypothetical protein